MKVAYNGCFGGFSLSPLAQTMYSKKKGIDLTWYEGIGDYPYKKFRKVDVKSTLHNGFMSSLMINASTRDLGDIASEIPEENYFYESWHGEDEKRSDPDLIEVIEALGEKANGSCANLCIKEIPDGAQFEITEYDGNEDVLPPRQYW